MGSNRPLPIPPLRVINNSWTHIYQVGGQRTSIKREVDDISPDPKRVKLSVKTRLSERDIPTDERRPRRSKSEAQKDIYYLYRRNSGFKTQDSVNSGSPDSTSTPSEKKVTLSPLRHSMTTNKFEAQVEAEIGAKYLSLLDLQAKCARRVPSLAALIQACLNISKEHHPNDDETSNMKAKRLASHLYGHPTSAVIQEKKRLMENDDMSVQVSRFELRYLTNALSLIPEKHEQNVLRIAEDFLRVIKLDHAKVFIDDDQYYKVVNIDFENLPNAVLREMVETTRGYIGRSGLDDDLRHRMIWNKYIEDGKKQIDE